MDYGIFPSPSDLHLSDLTYWKLIALMAILSAYQFWSNIFR